jgi:hypothetical protein
MKKIILSCFIIAGFVGKVIAQGYDDGYVSTPVSVNTAEPRFVSYVENFRSGLNKVKERLLTSADGIASYYGIDIRNYPKLADVVGGANWTGYGTTFSPIFLTRLKESIDRLSYEYENLGQFRNNLLEIAVTNPPTKEEAEVLALVDISVQEITKEFAAQDVSFESGIASVSGAVINGLTDILNVNPSQPFPINEFRLGKWVKCALGVIGSAILGGLTGARGGGSVGAIFGPGGAAVGAAVGGIAGVIGGAFTGAASFCE